MRIVAKRRTAPHDIIFIKACRPDSQSTFEGVFHRNHNRTDVPIQALIVLERAAMPCSTSKAAELHTQRIGLRRKWPQRRWPDYYPIRVAAKLGTRRTILEVILPVVLGDMSSFHKGIEESIVHVLAESLPTVFVRFEEIQLLAGADRI